MALTDEDIEHLRETARRVIDEARDLREQTQMQLRMLQAQRARLIEERERIHAERTTRMASEGSPR